MLKLTRKTVRQQYFLRIPKIYKWMRPSVAGEGRRELLNSMVCVLPFWKEVCWYVSRPWKWTQQRQTYQSVLHKGSPRTYKNSIIGTVTATQWWWKLKPVRSFMVHLQQNMIQSHKKDPVYLGGKIIVIKSAGSRIIQPSFKFYLMYSQAVTLASWLTFLCLSFLIHKMKTIIPSP